MSRRHPRGPRCVTDSRVSGVCKESVGFGESRDNEDNEDSRDACRFHRLHQLQLFLFFLEVLGKVCCRTGQRKKDIGVCLEARRPNLKRTEFCPSL